MVAILLKSIGFISMTNRVSVIIPFYNNAKFINRCLRSIESQTIEKSEFKIILVDDGSSEKLKIPNLDKNLELHVLTHSENRGLPVALNTALKNCETQFFVRVDSDDFVHERFLELLLFKMINSPGLIGASCDYWSVDKYENRLEEHNAIEDPIGCGIIFKTEILNQAGYYSEEMKMAEEVEFRRRIERVGKIGHVSFSLYRYVRHANNMTNDQEKYNRYKDLLK